MPNGIPIPRDSLTREQNQCVSYMNTYITGIKTQMDKTVWEQRKEDLGENLYQE